MGLSHLTALAFVATPLALPLALPQADPLWAVRHETGGAEALIDMIALSNGGTILSTSAPLDSPARVYWLRGYDPNGNLAWERGTPAQPTQVPNAGGFFGLAEASDGGFFSLLSIGGQVRMHKRDANGERLWTGMPAFGLLAAPDGGCVTWATAGVLRTRIRRFATDGTLVWDHRVEGELRDFEMDAFGNVYLFGNNEITGATATPVMAGRIGLNGVVQMTSCSDFNCSGAPYSGWYEDPNVWSPPFSQTAAIELTMDSRRHSTMLTATAWGVWKLQSFDRGPVPLTGFYRRNPKFVVRPTIR